MTLFELFAFACGIACGYAGFVVGKLAFGVVGGVVGAALFGVVGWIAGMLAVHLFFEKIDDWFFRRPRLARLSVDELRDVFARNSHGCTHEEAMSELVARGQDIAVHLRDVQRMIGGGSTLEQRGIGFNLLKKFYPQTAIRLEDVDPADYEACKRESTRLGELMSQHR